VTGTELTIRVLTCSALAGLLGAVGLRLRYAEAETALRGCRFAAILFVNFVVIPALGVAVASAFALPRDVTVAMILLAASPFAPVVPVFARLVGADLPLAAALTGIFPLFSALLTPLAAWGALQLTGNTNAVRFDVWNSLLLLLTTISLPLAAGVLMRHRAANLARRLLRPIELLSEALGAASLAFVTVAKFGAIADLGWRAWLAMAILSELSLLLGWQLGPADRGARQVTALGTSNRNIALALLVAIQSFHGTEVASAVTGNGLLLIGLGLLHVGWWRIGRSERLAS
jgi:BASS family bile acid:Na+ symporter